MNPDILALIKKAEESLGVARELHKGRHYDFAASRSYYAMFYISEAALLDKGKTFSSHRSVHNGFYHEFVETGIVDKNHHQSFVRGFQLRQAGDYGGFASVSENQSEDILKRASSFIHAVLDICNLDHEN